MGTLTGQAIAWLIENTLINPLLSFLASAFSDYNLWAQKAVNMQWVQTDIVTTTTVAGGLLFVKLAWTALSQYILWNEGTADMDGGQVWKGLLRTAIYGAAGTTLVVWVFSFGALLGSRLMTATIQNAVTTVQGLDTALYGMAGLPGVGTLIFGLILLIITLVLLCVLIIQMAVRAADLVFYAVAAPIVSVGQLSPDGGVWNSWWRGLVVLGMSQAVQLLGVTGMYKSIEIVGTTTHTFSGFGIALFLMIGFAIATIRGPHMMKEWAYHTGLGGMYTSVLSGAIRSVGARLGG